MYGPDIMSRQTGGWWYAELNLEDTIAISHNYCSPTNFNSVWREARNKRPRMAFHWLKHLEQEFPDLSDIANKVSDDIALDQLLWIDTGLT